MFKKKPPDHFKDLLKLKPLTNSDVNLTTSKGEVVSTVLNKLLIQYSYQR